MKNFLLATLNCALILVTGLLLPQNSFSQSNPTPLVNLNHEELSPPTNSGTLPIVFTKSANVPAATGNVAPSHGALGENGFDFGTSIGNYYVESNAVVNGLKNLSEFTLTGWLNAASLTAGAGGNRIISWINNGGDGVDLVLQNNGSLRLGVDGWPDNSPAVSSAAKVTASPQGGSENWVFFAVTYTSSGQAKFYFGNGANNAVLDVTRTYTGPGITGSNIGKLAFGAFNSATRNSGTWDRMYRGVLDDLRIYGSALNLTDIVNIQKNNDGDVTPPTPPSFVSVSYIGSTSIALSWQPGEDNVGVVGYDLFDNGAPLASAGAVTSYSLTGLTSDRDYNITIRSRDAAGNLSPPTPNLVLRTEPLPPNTPLLFFPLNDVAGGTPANVGIATGISTSIGGGPPNAYLPGSSLETPPYVGGTTSADFGTTPANAFIESQAPINELKNLNAFTITGWVNCKSSTTGAGGNRIVSWINSGGDGVDLVYQSNGSLRLGVDGWPDNSPAFSNANKVTTNSSAPQSNWVFFAVTYQSTGQVQFYFGTNTAAATLDATKTYSGPGVTGSNIGKFAIGAFNSTTRNPGTYDRMFRGLVDDIRVFGSALTLTDLISVQGKSSSDITPPAAPGNLTATSKTVSSISLSWTPPTDPSGINEYLLYNGANVVAHINSAANTVSSFTLTGLTAATTYNLSLKAADGAGNLSTASNSISVITDATGVPLAIIDMKFEENNDYVYLNDGTSVLNLMLKSQTIPSSSSLVPNVSNDQRSVDFGTTVGDYYIENWVSEIQSLNSFTLTGWLNNRSNTVGSGGNRVISWTNNGGDGVDLVYQADGSLRLGVDEFAGNSPAVSSSNKIPTDPNAGASNWVFFAVTYQSNGQVEFYFGNNATDATLDVTKTYPGRGVTGGNIGELAFGAFNNATRSSSTFQNMFRGIIDNFKIYGSNLSIADIRSIQHGVYPDVTPPSAPSNLEASRNEGTLIELSWDPSTDNIGVRDYQLYNGTTLLQTQLGPYNTATVTDLTPGTNYQFSVRARDAAGNLSPVSNVLNIKAKVLPLIYVPFSEVTANLSQNNLGTLGSSFVGFSGTGTTPNGGAPYSLGGSVTSTRFHDGLANLSAFTITGWVNRTSNANPERILGWMPNGGGDGVELLIQPDGRLRLGVDGIAENSPAVSSANKITTNASAPQNNWVFFAVTYKSNGDTQFYFGNDAADATADVAVNYPAGITGSNIGDAYITAPSGGYIDEIRVFGSVITLQEIIDLQHGPPDNIAPTTPGTLSVNSAETTSTSITLHWSEQSTDNIGVTSYDVFSGNTFIKHHVPTFKAGNFSYTIVTGLTPGTTYSFVVKARDSRGNYSAPTNSVQETTLTAASVPLVWLKFDGGVYSPINEGTAQSSFASSYSYPQSLLPALSQNVPTGIASTNSADFGSVNANAFVESTTAIDQLKNMSSFTITGWLNNKSNVTGSGGNRIVTWINSGGDGVDLVYQNNGSLRLGVDSWPDTSPAFSSANKIHTDANASAANWVFFAVTYSDNGTVQFYFGDNTVNAALDVTKSYPGRGAVGSNIGKLAIGNFNSATRVGTNSQDRLFKGLVDDIRIFGSVLQPQEIARVQRVTGSSSSARSIAAAPETPIKDEYIDEVSLQQNYPNPFSSITNIEVNIPHSVKVARLVLNDLTGRSLQNINIEGRGPTSVSVSSDGLNSGIYIYTLITDGKVVGYKRMAVNK